MLARRLTSFAVALSALTVSAVTLSPGRTASAQNPVPFEIFPGHPRVFFRETGDADHTGRADLVRRIRDPLNWQPVWERTILPACNRLVGMDESDIVENSDTTADEVLMLAFAGWIEGNAAYKAKAIDLAMYISAMSLDYIQNSTHARWGTMALAMVYDILHDDPLLTAAKRSAIGARILVLCDRLTREDSEHIGGHSHGDQVVSLIGVCAIAGEIPGWETRLARGLQFWFAPGTGFIETLRYFCKDGGHFHGSWYSFLVGFHDAWLFTALTNATKNLRPFATETWMRKETEWYLNVSLRGDGDVFTFCDTPRPQSPLFHNSQRSLCAILADRYRDPQMRWLYDRLDQLSLARGDAYVGPSMVYDVIFLDKTKVPSVGPASSTYRKARLFDPPGAFFYRDTWDYEKATIILVNAEEWFLFWHQHLESGSIQIAWKDDVVLLNRGLIGSGEVVGSEHHRNWYTRSISKSGVPLVFNPSETYERYGASSLNPASRIGNDGGQHWKKFVAPDGRRSQPYDMKSLLQDGGGLAWSRGGFTTMREDDDYVFLHADIAPAYLKEHDDPPRVTRCECKWLVLKRAGKYPMVLCLQQVESANAAWRKAIPWQFATRPTVSGGRISANGYKGKGKCVLDVLRPERFGFTVVGGGTVDGYGYGSSDFSYGGANWPPAAPTNARNAPTLGKYRLEVSPRTASRLDEFVTLIMPMGVADSPPTYRWIEEAEWFGIEIGGIAYRIGRKDRVATKLAAGTTPAEPPDDPPDDPVDPPPPPPVTTGWVVLDNGGTGTSSTGAWGVSGGLSPYGKSSVYSRYGATYTYALNVPAAGTYEVRAWWTTWPSRATRVPIEIRHASGTATVEVNQLLNGGRWNLLGTYQFGSTATIRITAVGSSSTCADAVALVPVSTPQAPVTTVPQAPVATIDQISPNPAAVGQTIEFKGSATDPQGLRITGYQWRSSLIGEISRGASFSTSSLPAGRHGILFCAFNEAGLRSVAAQQFVVVSETPTTEPGAIVLDNGQPGTSFVGAWFKSLGEAPYGAESLFANSGGPTYTYTFTVTGTFGVEAWWTSRTTRSQVVPIRIQHSGGTATVRVNQREDGGKWNPLGRFTFSGKAVVTVVAEGGGATTCADAIRLVP